MRIITVVIPAFSFLGAIDFMIGNRFGIGKEFGKAISLFANDMGGMPLAQSIQKRSPPREQVRFNGLAPLGDIYFPRGEMIYKERVDFFVE